jgi:hypothetical protein
MNRLFRKHFFYQKPPPYRKGWRLLRIIRLHPVEMAFKILALMMKDIASLSIKHKISLGLIGLVSLIALIQTGMELSTLSQARAATPFFFAGNKFSGLETILKGETYVGYWSDRDMTVDKNGALFAQAQLIMAPVILDLNNTTHRYTLLDCDDPKRALDKIREIGATPVKANNMGVVLALRLSR